MGKPLSRKKQKNRYLLLSIGSYFGILFVACHMGQVTDEPDIYQIFMAGIEHMKHNPLDLFPLNKPFMAKAAFFAMIAPLLLHTEYLRTRDLRPAEESGSAKWNEDLRSFYQGYTEMSLSWPKLFQVFPFKFLKNFLVRLDKVFRKIPILRGLYKMLYNAIVKRIGVVNKDPGVRNMIFTNDVYMSMDGRKTRRNNNVLCIGGSGTGKSRFLVKPSLLQANCSYVITDPSGELLETMGKCLQEMGYEVRVFNLVQMEYSNCYNPFHYIRNEEGVLVMINSLIKNTNPKDSHSSDPFWEKAETALLQACCFYLVSECPKDDQNFANVMKLLRCASAIEGQENVDSALDILFKDLEAKDPEHIACQCYKIFKSAGGGKTAQSILISCQTRLQTFNLSAIKNLTNTDNINLGDIGDKPVALFCTTPTADTTFNYLVALLYTQLFETLYYHAETQCKGKRLKHHVRFLLDEFANIGTIPDFAQKLSTMRKYEISCTIIIQALSQLKAMYKDDWEVLVGNCDSLLFLGGSDTTTLEYFSKLLGKETIRSINNSRSFGKQGSHSMSYNKTGRELMTPDELRVMNNKNCVLFIRGLYPFFSTKYTLEKHPNYYLTGDADDSQLFDVRKSFRTGRRVPQQRPISRPMRIVKDAERADGREAERQHRINTRPVQNWSAQGQELGRIRPLEEEIPVLKQIRLPEEMTEEQRASLERQTANLRIKSGSRPEEIGKEAYTAEEIALFATINDYYNLVDDEEAYEAHETADDEREEQ